MSASRLGSGIFFGVPTRKAMAGDLLLVETTYAPGSTVSAHWHERPYLCYLVRGAFEERSGGRTRSHGPGSLVFHPAGETHADRFGRDGGVCFNIEVSQTLLASMDSRELRAADRAVPLGGGGARRLAAQMRREFQRPDAASDLILEGLGLALLGEAWRTADTAAPQPPVWLPRAVDLLHDRFHEPLTLGGIAAQVRVHPVHLARTFRRHQGVTVGEYIRTLRLDFACRELMAGHRTVAEIAHASGFADHAHFCRTFRAAMGTSPTGYRARGGSR